MTDKLQSAAQGAASQAQQVAGEGSKYWDVMSEEQKKKTFDSLPEAKKQGKSYVEWIKEGYQHQYENWMPWIEDQYLKWFTKDNKASYATKGELDKTKVTGVEPVDKLQDGVNNLVSGQVGKGGVLQPAGDAASKEGVNRAERGGKDDSGSYGGAVSGGGVADPVASSAQTAGESTAGGAQGLAGSAWSGAKSVGGSLGGVLGGNAKKDG